MNTIMKKARAWVALSLLLLSSLIAGTSVARELVYGNFSERGEFLGFSTADGNSTFNLPSTAGSLYSMSVIGDSRSSDFNINPQSKSAKSWVTWAMAYYQQSFRITANYGVSGNRSDQYLTNGNFQKALSDGSGWLVMGPPVVNDIGQASSGYTDTYGNAVTLTNVVDVTVAKLTGYVKQARAAGKRVIVVAEYGAQSFNATQVAAVHEFNRRYQDAIKDLPGVYWVNFNPLVWDKTSSATAINFNTGFTLDGTHAVQLMGETLGKWFAQNFLPSVMPKVDSAVANLNDTVINGSAQLYANPLLSTLTGGVTGSNITVTSGNVPGSVTVSGSAAGLSVVITSAANANGFGNDVTFAFTASGATTGRIDFTIPNQSNWALSDYIETGVEIDRASSCAGNIYSQTQLNSNLGTYDAYDLYSVTAGVPSSAAATGLVLRSLRNTWIPGSTAQGYLLHRLNVAFTGAGTCTITVRRPFIERYR